MKIISRNGYLCFYPKKREDLKRFARLFSVEFTPKDDFFTLTAFADLPRYSIQGQTFGGIPAVANFEGQHPGEVLAANEFVLNLKTNVFIPMSAIASVVSLSKTAEYAIASGILVQPGSFLRTGERIVSYRGEIDLDFQRLYLTDWGSV